MARRLLRDHPATVQAVWLLLRLADGPARWVSRRFTTAGAMVGAGILVTLGTANPTQTLGLPAFLVLGTVLLAAMLWAPFFRAPVVVRRQAPRLAPCDQPVSVTVEIRNRSRTWQKGLIYGEDLRQHRVTRQDVVAWLRQGRRRQPESTPVVVPPLPPGGTAHVTVLVTARRRGLLTIPGSLLSRSDPLGLFRAFQPVPGVVSLLVLPPRYPVPPIDLPGVGRAQPGGVALASGVGAAEEFAALRDYRRGDPRRHIHWRSSARRGQLVVKEHHDEELVRYALILDPGVAGADEAFEDAVAVAASFACTNPDQEALLDLLFVGERAVTLTSGRGVGHAGPMLEALAGVEPRPEQLPSLQALVRAHARRVGGAVVVLVAYDESRRAVIRDLRLQGIPTLVLLIGEAPSEVPAQERPDRLVVLTPGRIAEGLAALGTTP